MEDYKRPTDEELKETLEEIVDDPDYFYEDEEEFRESRRLGILLKCKNILILLAFFIVVVFCVGLWRTLVYGKTQNGYTIVNSEREKILDYLKMTDDWQTDIILFEENVKELNKNSLIDASVSASKKENLESNVDIYKKRVEKIAGEKYFINKNNFMNNNQKMRDDLKKYNDIIIEIYNDAIVIMENEKYFGSVGYEDFNSNGTDIVGIEGNYLTWQSDTLLDNLHSNIEQLKRYRVSIEQLRK